MLSTDKQEFNKTLLELFDLYNRQVTPSVFETWFSVMEKYPLTEIREAMAIYAVQVSFPPVPAGVIKYIKTKPRPITAEEAWAYFPKAPSQSGYVTKRMLIAFGAAEEMLAMDDLTGARFAFVNTYNSIPEDNLFTDYTMAEGVDFEELTQRKINDLKLLESKQWMPHEAVQAKMNNLLSSQKEKKLLTIDNGLSTTKKELNKQRAADLRQTMTAMLNSNQKATGQD